WVHNVEISNSSQHQMWMYCVNNSEISHCYTHGGSHGGGNSEGIDLYIDACWNKVQDNICNQGGFPQIIVNDWGGGGSGNVIAYNYCVNQYTGSSTGQGDIDVNHGPHGMFNLVEGNISQGMVSDSFYGSASHGTAFRNWFYATSPTLTEN